MQTVAVLAFFLAAFGFAYSASLGIAGGSEVKKNSIPYQAHLYLLGDFLQNWNCSGVLISENYVLTTSKCMWSGPTNVTVILGAHDISENETSQQSISSDRRQWRIYPSDFVYESLENNIGLVKLPSSATLNEYVQPAKLSSSNNVTVGQTGTISGWGGDHRALETVLESASVTVVNNSVCAAAYDTLYTGDNIICVQGTNGAAGCVGDGGAPLVIDGVVVGVFSGGPIYTNQDRNCTGKPNVFTRLSSYYEWIRSHSDI